VDVSETFGSEDFITQRDEPPPAMELIPPPPTSPLPSPPQQLLKGSSEGEWEDIPTKKQEIITKQINKSE
jgi:hypothetical protein